MSSILYGLLFSCMLMPRLSLAFELDFETPSQCAAEQKNATIPTNRNYLQKDLEWFYKSQPSLMESDDHCEECCEKMSMLPENSGILSLFNISKSVDTFTNPLSKCIFHSMKNAIPVRFKNPWDYEKNIHYAYCSPDSGSHRGPNSGNGTGLSKAGGITLPLGPPCLTKEYHGIVYKAFMTAAQCTGVDPYRLFGLFNRETRFMTNVCNPSGFCGVAQFQRGAAKDVENMFLTEKNQSDFTYFMNDPSFSDEQRSACRKLGKTLGTPINPGSSNLDKCSRVSFPTNPFRSFLYGALYYKVIERYADVALKQALNPDENERPMRKAAFAKFKQWDFDTINIVLRHYIYNAGYPKIKDMLTNYFETKENPKWKTFFAENNISYGYDHFTPTKFLEEFQRYLSVTSTFGWSKAKQKEVSSYVKNIEIDSKIILEKDYGRNFQLKDKNGNPLPIEKSRDIYYKKVKDEDGLCF